MILTPQPATDFARIAVFASGNGSNMQRLAEYGRARQTFEVAAVYCNRPDAFVLERARSLGIPATVFGRDSFYNSNLVPESLQQQNIGWIVLAGFLWLIPPAITEAYEGRILNIHPALLPLHGGKGKYGQRVHEAVIAAGETQSGITIHYVNSQYDEGDIIFQAACPVLPNDTPETLAAKIHQLEYEHYPRVIEQIVNKG